MLSERERDEEGEARKRRKGETRGLNASCAGRGGLLLYPDVLLCKCIDWPRERDES